MKVALYARVSTKGQAERDLSIPDQVRQLTEYCARRGYEILRIFREEGESATDDNRPVFRDMIYEATRKGHPFEAILVLTTSRFFRDSRLAKHYKYRLTKKGVRVIAAAQELPDDPLSAPLLESIFEIIDEHESRMIGYHTLRGLKENARRGFYNGSPPPYGYFIEKVTDERGNLKSRLAVDPEKALTVKEIFERYLAGDGAKAIAERLNRLGVPTRSAGPWSKNRILNVLRDTVYVGEYRYNRGSHRNRRRPMGEPIAVPVEPIIEKEKFEKAQALRAERDPEVTNPAVTASPTLLLGLLRCVKCGARMTLETAKGGRFRYYNCSRFLRSGSTTCPGQRIPKELLETQLLCHLAEGLFTTQRTKSIMKGLADVLKKNRSELARHNGILSKQLQDLEARRARYWEIIEKGTLAVEDVAARLRELNRHIEALQLETVKSRDLPSLPAHYFTERAISTFQDNVKGLFLNGDRIVAKHYLKHLVTEIKVEGDQVNITGNALALPLFMGGSPEGAGQGVLTARREWLLR